MSVTVDKLLSVQLVQWINDNRTSIPLPTRIKLDQHTDTGTQIWLQPLAGTTRLKTYIDGGYIGELPFAVYNQETNPDYMGELDVPLWNLSIFFERQTPNIPIAKVNSIEMTSTPNAFARDEGKTYINQAIYLLNYTKGAEKNGRRPDTHTTLR